MQTLGCGTRSIGTFAAVVLVASMPAMATTITMTIEGATQGVIAQRIHVQSVTHSAVASQGAGHTGRPHGAIIVVKQIDSTSPNLFKASASGEILREVMIAFEGGAGGGNAAERIELKDAFISGIQRTGMTESITMNYDTIIVTRLGGGRSMTDDWTAPR